MDRFIPKGDQKSSPQVDGFILRDDLKLLCSQVDGFIPKGDQKSSPQVDRFIPRGDLKLLSSKVYEFIPRGDQKIIKSISGRVYPKG